jgi:methyltransferase (TIGR00027 family)
VQREPDGSLEGVSETALGAAEMRAEESHRADRLFDDPYASAFVAAAPPLFPDLPSLDDDPELAALKDAFHAGIAIRTRFYDDFLVAACAAGCRQVVILAAGLDTRAFRLDWPAETRVFELDLPNLFAFKESVLTQQHATPKCTRRVVAVDLRDDWPTQLVAAGFEPDLPSAWTAEGLLAYLSNDDAARLLTSIGDQSATGSELSFEYDDFAADSTLSQVRAMPGMEEVASLWEGGLAEPPGDWLRSRGWQVRTHDRASLARSYRRPLADATGGFVTATRKEQLDFLSPIGETAY